jgi:predicted HicB family RNase H-like nuclease
MKEEIRTSLRMEKDLHKKVRHFCFDNEVSLNDFVINAIEYCLENKLLPKKGKEKDNP